MKRKMMCMAVFIIIATLLTACKKTTCQEPGCKETEIYDAGYCKKHYYENVGNNLLEEFSEFLGY